LNTRFDPRAIRAGGNLLTFSVTAQEAISKRESEGAAFGLCAQAINIVAKSGRLGAAELQVR